jgi:hypothetical protein
MTRPEFTILVPTRNRSEHIGTTLIPLAHQTHRDYEIVVSDNSDPEHFERIDAVVASLKGRVDIRVVRPETTLNMTDHWNFALGHARGHHIGVVTDRMTLLPTTLEHVRRHLKEGSRCVSFGLSTLKEDDGHFSLEHKVGELRTETFQSLDVLKLFAKGNRIKTLPLLLNCFVERDVLERMKCETGQVLLGISPDYSFLFNYLGRYETYCHIHQAFRIDHAPHLSNGASFTHGKPNAASTDFLARMMAEQKDILKLRPMPMEFTYIANILLSEYALAEQSIPGASFPPLDMAAIHRSCWRQALSTSVTGDADRERSLKMLDQFRQQHGLPAPSIIDRLQMKFRKRRNLLKARRRDARDIGSKPSGAITLDETIARGQKVRDFLLEIDPSINDYAA